MRGYGVTGEATVAAARIVMVVKMIKSLCLEGKMKGCSKSFFLRFLGCFMKNIQKIKMK